MNKRLAILLGVAALLLVLVIVRAISTGGGEEIEYEQYMYCNSCGATYEIGEDFMLNLSPGDYKKTPEGVIIFRCKECGAMDAHPEMRLIKDGKVVEDEVSEE